MGVMGSLQVKMGLILQGVLFLTSVLVWADFEATEYSPDPKSFCSGTTHDALGGGGWAAHGGLVVSVTQHLMDPIRYPFVTIALRTPKTDLKCGSGKSVAPGQLLRLRIKCPMEIRGRCVNGDKLSSYEQKIFGYDSKSKTYRGLLVPAHAGDNGPGVGAKSIDIPFSCDNAKITVTGDGPGQTKIQKVDKEIAVYYRDNRRYTFSYECIGGPLKRNYESERGFSKKSKGYPHRMAAPRQDVIDAFKALNFYGRQVESELTHGSKSKTLNSGI